MNVRSKLIAVALGSAVLGAAGGSFLHAQTAVPAAYLIAEVQVTDPDGWKQYLAALPGTLAPFHEKTLARSQAVALDASTPPSGAVASGDENGYPAAVWLLNCPNNPATGKPEITWVKTMQGTTVSMSCRRRSSSRRRKIRWCSG